MIIVSFFFFSIPFILSLTILANIKSYYIIVISSLLYGISIFALFKGGCTDPGIIPRQRGNGNAFRNKREYNIVSNGSVLKYTYCYTCDIFRPPRTSHCAACDNCCQRFDHHCLWLGNCIGKRNYKYFFILISSLNLNAIIEIIYNICIIVQSIKDKEEKKIKYRTFTISVLAFSIFFDFMFIIFFLGKLQIVHVRLVLKNFTFYEDFKKRLKNPANINPFHKNLWQHIYRLLIELTPKSLLNGNVKKIELSNINNIIVNKNIKNQNVHIK